MEAPDSFATGDGTTGSPADGSPADGSPAVGRSIAARDRHNAVSTARRALLGCVLAVSLSGCIRYVPDERIIGTYRETILPGGYGSATTSLYANHSWATSLRACRGTYTFAQGRWAQLGDGYIVLFRDPADQSTMAVWRVEGDRLRRINSDTNDDDSKAEGKAGQKDGSEDDQGAALVSRQPWSLDRTYVGR